MLKWLEYAYRATHLAKAYFDQWLTEPASRIASEELFSERRFEERTESKFTGVGTEPTFKKMIVSMPTKLEDLAITAAAIADPDAQPLSDPQLNAMQSVRALRE